MYVAFYGEFKEEKGPEFINWWRDEANVKKFKENMTPGMKLVDVFFTINQTAKHDFEIWYEVDNWGVLDKDRENKKMQNFQKELYEKYGNFFQWALMKVLRTATDVKHPRLDN